jgi:hypothetical protein
VSRAGLEFKIQVVVENMHMKEAENITYALKELFT